MFSGIVEERGKVVGFSRSGNPPRISVQSSLDQSETKIGDSICVEGVCLTVVDRKENVLSFELLEETIRRSIFADLTVGSPVNLERSLQVGSRIHGHFVFGHVDATVRLLSREPDGDCERFTWELPEGYEAFITPKGSVALSGISLTVGEVQNRAFSVYIIPHTSSVTTLSDKKPGARVNLEIDMLARYVHASLHPSKETKSGITEEFLEEYGYVLKV